jgi:hypothetical protein
LFFVLAVVAVLVSAVILVITTAAVDIALHVSAVVAAAAVLLFFLLAVVAVLLSAVVFVVAAASDVDIAVRVVAVFFCYCSYICFSYIFVSFSVTFNTCAEFAIDGCTV